MSTKKLSQNEARAAWTRWAARCRVLGRVNSAAIAAPCVLASHPPIAPSQRVVIPLEALTSYVENRAHQVARDLILRHVTRGAGGTGTRNVIRRCRAGENDHAGSRQLVADRAGRLD